MADLLNGLGDDPDDLLSGLPEGVVDDSIRAIDADIKDKNSSIERIDDESKDIKERMAVMVEHLKNVQQELINTQQLIEAKTREVEAEDHLKQLAERETGRVIQECPLKTDKNFLISDLVADLQDVGKMERTAFELQDRLNITQNSIFRGNEKMDAFKLQMNWNQEEMEQWSVAAKQKEEDNLALQKYSRADESKIKEMSLAIEKLTRTTSARESELENEMTETLSAQAAPPHHIPQNRITLLKSRPFRIPQRAANRRPSSLARAPALTIPASPADPRGAGRAQIELDKTAADFKKSHAERGELVQQWEQARAPSPSCREAASAAGFRGRPQSARGRIARRAT